MALLLLAGKRFLLLPRQLFFQPPFPLRPFLVHALDHRLDGVGNGVGAMVEETDGLPDAAAELGAEESADLESVG